MSVPAEILGVQEQNRLPVRPILGIAVAEHARALRLELIARGQDIVDLVAHVMDAAVRTLLQGNLATGEFSPRGSSSSILCVRQRDELRLSRHVPAAASDR